MSLVAFITEVDRLAKLYNRSEDETLKRMTRAYQLIELMGGTLEERALIFDTIEACARGHMSGRNKSFAELYREMNNQFEVLIKNGCVPEPDEPSFTVLGRDQLAQATVVHWIDRAVAASVPEEKIDRARRRYDEIVKFQSDYPERVKVPD